MVASLLLTIAVTMIIFFIVLLWVRSSSCLLGFWQQLPKFSLSPVFLFLTSQFSAAEPLLLPGWALLFLSGMCFHSHRRSLNTPTLRPLLMHSACLDCILLSKSCQSFQLCISQVGLSNK